MRTLSGPNRFFRSRKSMYVFLGKSANYFGTNKSVYLLLLFGLHRSATFGDPAFSMNNNDEVEKPAAAAATAGATPSLQPKFFKLPYFWVASPVAWFGVADVTSKRALRFSGNCLPREACASCGPHPHQPACRLLRKVKGGSAFEPPAN